ncbi:tapasin isoform X1 [Phascolarctos cinereus]|uniref:Tapasin isoform X1 n=1 Tax=Phascolarctos cinereus TaxID=38626 RepID=A0A6P5LAT1_PHACI|nr:tapasin isoform X1 [Phascolarctos cinereus]
MKPLCLLLALGILAVRWATPRPGPSVLECWFVEEQGGGGMLRGVTKRPAVLLLRQGPGEPPPRPDLDSSLYLKVYDPAGSLGDSLKESLTPSCELNRYIPSPAASAWVAGLTPEPHSPRSLDGTWLVVSLSSPQVRLSSLLQLSQPQPVPSSVTIATAVMTVFSHSPAASVGPGKNAKLDLSFTYMPPNSGGAPSSLEPPPFGLEWRRQHRGIGQLLLAVTPGLGGQALGSPEGAVAFAAWDEEGVEGPWSGNGTLLLPIVKPHQEGTYLATVHLPHLQAQVALELEVQRARSVLGVSEWYRRREQGGRWSSLAIQLPLSPRWHCQCLSIPAPSPRHGGAAWLPLYLPSPPLQSENQRTQCPGVSRSGRSLWPFLGRWSRVVPLSISLSWADQRNGVGRVLLLSFYRYKGKEIPLKKRSRYLELRQSPGRLRRWMGGGLVRGKCVCHENKIGLEE